MPNTIQKDAGFIIDGNQAGGGQVDVEQFKKRIAVRMRSARKLAEMRLSMFSTAQVQTADSYATYACQ